MSESQGELFQDVPSVSELTRRLEEDLSRSYRGVAVRGEISNFRKAASGHMYFVLKDTEAQLKAVLFRGQARGLTFIPADGILVEARGDITLYAPRGDLQILVHALHPAGRGALMEALARLKEKLQNDGLFDLDRKQPLPRFPETVALVTSPRGAAIRDLVHVAQRRWPSIRLVLVPVRVQGREAAPEIAEAIERVDRWGGADVVIVGRGGGSLEDLWPFNEEPVIRAIAEARTPIVSAVGHESDSTLADFAADVRAATPSAAAELVVPPRSEVVDRVSRARRRITTTAHRMVTGKQEAVRHLVQAYGFRRPQEFLAREHLRLDRLIDRLQSGLEKSLESDRRDVDSLAQRLRGRHPRERFVRSRETVQGLGARLTSHQRHDLARSRVRLEGLARSLTSLSPGRVLDRGYAWVRHRDGTPVQSAVDLPPEAWVQFSRDRALIRTLEKRPGGPFDPWE